MSTINPVAPGTVITLYQGVEWDNSNKNIRWFTSSTQRTSYLSSHILLSSANCTAVRMAGKVRVEAQINAVLTANYMSFSNQGIGIPNRELFAFITSVDYVNVNTVEVTFEMDWIQSYLFNFTFEMCYVEREHVNDDTIGKNLVDENLDIGEYIVASQQDYNQETGAVCFYLDQSVGVQQINGVVSALVGQGFTMSEMREMSGFLSTFYDRPESMVMIYMVTANMLTERSTPLNPRRPKEFNYVQGMLRPPDNFFYQGDRYYAKNMKLKCFPYQLFTVDNYNGSIQQYHWEDFQYGSDLTVYFRIHGCPFPKPTMECYPINFKNGLQYPDTESDEMQQYAVKYDNFPQVAWATDAFRAWISQYGVSKVASTGATVATSVIGIIGNAAAGNYGAAVTGAINTAANLTETYQDYKRHEIHGQQLQGTVGSGGLDFEAGRVGFRYTAYCIKPEMAKRIDEYFTRYGYRVDATKVPNITGRAVCNYVKTINAKVGGNVPVDAMRALEAAMDSGTTFWHTDAIGAPVTDNPIV